MQTNLIEEVLAKHGLYHAIREAALNTPDTVETSAIMLADNEPAIPAHEKQYAAFLLEIHASQVMPNV